MTATLDVLSTAWMADPLRACLDAPQAWFFPTVAGDDEDEPKWPLPEATSLCERCPVKDSCRQWAIATGQEYGTWGGLSGYQRNLILKKQHRKTCPDCECHDIVIEHAHEICLGCGLSWPII